MAALDAVIDAKAKRPHPPHQHSKTSCPATEKVRVINRRPWSIESGRMRYKGGPASWLALKVLQSAAVR
jgi:hypothetical protein